MTTLQSLIALPSSGRIAELNRLLRALRMLDADLALTLGVRPQTVRCWMNGENPVPNPPLVTLAALERLPVEEREELILRKPRAVKAAKTLARIEAETYARPPLSAKQAGATR